jgi:hypothetical protein
MSAFALGLGGGYFAPRFPSRTEVQTESAAVIKDTANAEKIASEPDASLSPAATAISPTLLPQPVANSPLVISPGVSAEERHRQLRELPPEAFPTLMAELCSDIGPKGLEFQEQHLIQNGLRKWWKSNRETLLQWVASQPNSATKRYLMSEILEDFLLKEDPERAKTLAEAYKLQDPTWAAKDYNNIIVRGPIEVAWKNPQTTADEMLALYKNVSRGGTCYGTSVRVYPEEFDFRKFLDGLDTLNQTDGRLSMMPSDTLAAWAKRDPQQAAQWLLQAQAKWRQQSRSSLPFADWKEIAKSVAGNSGPQAYYDWAANFVGDLDETSRRSLLSAYGREGDVLGILSATKDATTRDKVLTSAIGASDAEQKLTYLKMLSTPEARLNAIRSNNQSLAELTKDFEVDKSVYRELGLTEKQVQDALTEDD